jgi:uncharacterized protein
MLLNVLLPKNSRQIFVPSRSGKLDCLVLNPINVDGITGVAIVFHPNPLEGGTYTNKVVQTIAKALNSKGYLCYCPNLRGVGMSDGVHDYGVGEIDDALDIHNYIRQDYPDLPLILAGFSFGTAVASSLATQVEYKKLMLVGSAVTRFKVIVPDKTKTIVIHGQDDEVIGLDSVFKWSKEHDLPIICYPNTGHFFHGKLVGLQNLITSFEY